MSVFKCKMCGGTIEFNPGDTVGTCDSCGSVQTLPKANDDVIANLFNRANNLRIKAEFDKAAEIYEKIVDKDNSNAEAHWGIVLCKYGIEYIEDPTTYKRVPTCHRAQYESIMADADYIAALENSDTAQRGIYTQQALEISNIQKGILTIVKDEKPFDVFICYKETDENGKRTVDSALANDIYYQLTQEGLKVFYAAITLEDKLGQEYEPYIFAALNSAKVMLVVGTKPEYFEAVWVRNEWSRYLKIMKNDRSKLLIPCYRDMDAYDLPEAFAHLQAQDMSKIGFVNDIVRGIKKVVGGSQPKAETVKEPVVVNSGVQTSNIVALIDRGFMALEDGEWAKADGFFEEALNQDAKNAECYLGKLMAELKVRNKDLLKNSAQPFDNNNNCIKASKFSTGIANKLQADNDFIRDRNETARKQGIYDEAKTKISKAQSENEFKDVAEKFAAIPGFKDADTLAEQCLDKAEICRKDAVYSSAKSKMTGEKTASYEKAIGIFKTISGWKDADEQIYACQKKIEEIKAKEEADRLEAERKAEERRVAAEKTAKKRKKAFAIGTPIVAACIAFLIVLTTVIIPNSKYNTAVSLMDEGKYDEAIAAFEATDGYKDSANKISDCQTALKDIDYNAAVSLLNDGKIIDAYESLVALNGYKDSATKASEIFNQYKIEKLKIVEVGDIVYFGAYEQDNNTSNGKEDMEWIVLAKENEKALVISKYALDCQRYNTSHTNVTWETCSLRKWMNGTFLNNAFSAEEQAQIQNTNVSADKNPQYSTNPGNATTDKVFLLSITEAGKYFTTDELRKCSSTAYAKAQGAYTSDIYETASGEATCWWWLRSPGHDQLLAAYVFTDSSVYYGGNYVGYGDGCVRPALWITLQ